MPLTYDDVPGSWGNQSSDWPALHFTDDDQLERAFIACTKTNLIPYGSYVCVDACIRFESPKEKAIIQDYLNNSPHRTYEELKQHFIDTGRWP